MKKICIILLALVGLNFGPFISGVVNAAEAQPSTLMKVKPVIEELSLKPATKADKKIFVKNQGEKDMKVRVYIAPYSFSVENNASDFESQTDYTQIYHWIKIKGSDSKYRDEVEFKIKPQKVATINYRIEVPKSAPGGSQHACIFVETVPDEQAEGDIVTVSRAAVKVFANVSGKTVNDAEVEGLNTDTLVIDGKVSAKSTVKNIGNIDIKPTLTLKINSLSGETVFSGNDIKMIFPESSDELKVEWPDTPTFGIYNLIAATNILGKDVLVEKTIFIMPSWFIVLLLIIIVAITITLMHFYKIHRAKKQRNGARGRT